jgi:hypothetical protein
MRQAVETSPLHILLAAISDERLCAVIVELARNGASAGDDELGQAHLPGAAAAPPPPAPPAPAPRRRLGWPKGRPRKPGPPEAVLAERRAKYAAAARAKRAAARAAKNAKAGKSNGHGKPTNGAADATPAAALWRHAEQLRPRDPWVVVARELGVNPALSKDCYRSGELPPGMADSAVTRFVELPIPAG